MKTIRTFDSPTDVYIVGAYFDDAKPTLHLMDDESDIIVTNGRDNVHVCCQGYIFIMTEQELRAAIPELDEEDSWNEEDWAIIPGFQGPLMLSALDDAGNELIGETFSLSEDEEGIYYRLDDHPKLVIRAQGEYQLVQISGTRVIASLK